MSAHLVRSPAAGGTATTAAAAGLNIFIVIVLHRVTFPLIRVTVHTTWAVVGDRNGEKWAHPAGGGSRHDRLGASSSGVQRATDK